MRVRLQRHSSFLIFNGCYYDDDVKAQPVMITRLCILGTVGNDDDRQYNLTSVQGHAGNPVFGFLGSARESALLVVGGSPISSNNQWIRL